MKIEEARINLGLTINEMAATMGVHRQTWVKWERDEQAMNATTRQHLTLLTWLHDNHPAIFDQWISAVQ